MRPNPIQPATRKPARPYAPPACRWVAAPTPGAAGVVELTRAGLTRHYRFTLFPIDKAFGIVGVEWGNVVGDEPYHVAVRADGSCQCDCRGFAAHGHCKHAHATPILLADLAAALPA